MPVTDWLSTVPEAVVLRLRKDAVRMNYGDGQLIHARGERKPGLSIIHSGRVKFGTTGANGNFIQFIVLGAGEVFGEMSIFTGVGRWHDAFAVGPAVIDQLSGDRFLDIIEEYPALSIQLLRLMAWRLHLAFEGVDAIMRRPLVDRIGRHLLDTNQSHEINGEIELRQAQLAEAMGASRVAINKALRELADLGFLTTGYGHVRLHNREKLTGWLAARSDVIPL